MYERHFAFRERPFSIAPDPRFLYLSDSHRDALAHLLYGLNDAGGFVLLTGEVGTGKTTLSRSLLAQIPEQTEVAFVLNPRLHPIELLETICDELKVPYERDLHSVKRLIDAINEHLLRVNADGRSTVLIIDEAQNLSTAVLEQLRLLTNLETNERKLLRIILLGQPELAAKLDKPELRQLSQRIVARFNLKPLTRRQTNAYIQHRLAFAGSSHRIFSPIALRLLYQRSGGIPRLVNVIADRALLGAYAQGKANVGASTLWRAANEVSGAHRLPRRWYLVPIFALLAVSVAAAYYLAPDQLLPTLSSPAPAAPPASSPATPLLTTPLPASTETLTRPAVASDTAPLADTDAPLSWPSELDQANSLDLAFAALFDRWHSPYQRDRSENACDYARNVGLSCLFERGEWRQLIELNQPAILNVGGGDQRFYLALLGVKGDQAEIVIGNRHRRLPVSLLMQRWDGTYTALWQMPPGYRGPTAIGSVGDDVTWLRQQLLQLDPEHSINRDAKQFDKSLADALADFQRSAGLLADSIAGPRTWMAINQRIGLPVPTLLEAP